MKFTIELMILFAVMLMLALHKYYDQPCDEQYTGAEC